MIKNAIRDERSVKNVYEDKSVVHGQVHWKSPLVLI